MDKTRGSPAIVVIGACGLTAACDGGDDSEFGFGRGSHFPVRIVPLKRPQVAIVPVVSPVEARSAGTSGLWPSTKSGVHRNRGTTGRDSNCDSGDGVPHWHPTKIADRTTTTWREVQDQEYGQVCWGLSLWTAGEAGRVAA